MRESLQKKRNIYRVGLAQEPHGFSFSPLRNLNQSFKEVNMAKIGDRFKTGETCETTGSYVFDGYLDGKQSPSPTSEERVIPMTKNNTFPPIRSSGQAAWWKLQRIG